MKEEELRNRAEIDSPDLPLPITGIDLIKAAADVDPFTYDKTNIDGVYHMEPNTLEVEVHVTRSPLKINIDKLFVTLCDVIRVNDLHFRCGGVDVKDIASGVSKRYLIVSQFYP